MSNGGETGPAGNVRLASGAQFEGKGTQTIPTGERVIIEMPGGGGLGDPKARDAEAVAADVSAGLVSVEAAGLAEGLDQVALTAAGKVDGETTARLRGGAGQ